MEFSLEKMISKLKRARVESSINKWRNRIISFILELEPVLMPEYLAKIPDDYADILLTIYCKAPYPNNREEEPESLILARINNLDFSQLSLELLARFYSILSTEPEFHGFEYTVNQIDKAIQVKLRRKLEDNIDVDSMDELAQVVFVLSSRAWEIFKGKILDIINIFSKISTTEEDIYLSDGYSYLRIFLKECREYQALIEKQIA